MYTKLNESGSRTMSKLIQSQNSSKMVKDDLDWEFFFNITRNWALSRLSEENFRIQVNDPDHNSPERKFLIPFISTIVLNIWWNMDPTIQKMRIGSKKFGSGS